MSQLQLSLLGEPLVKHGEDTLTFSTRKALALLVYLAVEGGTQARKTLSESLWPELDAGHGRAALRATLFELRQLLERSHGPGEQAHLHVGGERLGLEQDSPLLLDLRLVEAVNKHVGRPGAPLADQVDAESLSQLEQATRLARGPFLAGFTLRDSQFFDDWTRQQREYWHVRVHQLFDAVSRIYERAGDVEQALETVNRWLGFDPLYEEGYRSLMRLRFSLGDRSGALRAYATCRDVLADALEIEPEPETVALAKRIRRTAPVRSLQSQPPHSSHGQPPANLLDGSFLGRSAEFSRFIECYQRVHAGEPQLVLLQGETGMGKTRLATELLGWAQAQGAEVLMGQSLPTGRHLPYQPLIEVLRRGLEQEHAPDDLGSPVWLAELARLLPELRERSPDLPISTTDGALADSRLFEATARLLQGWAARRPLVLFLDDLHWADTATLDLVLYLAQRLAEQPAPVLLLLTLRTGTAPLPVPPSTWVIALKRMRIALTALVLTPFTKGEMQRFVQALAWAEQQEVELLCSTDRCPESRGSSTFREHLASLANWLYAQTGGQPFYLAETLKGLLERAIIVPSLQENGTWGLMLRSELLAQTPTSELIPASVRERVRSQLGQLSPSAWTVLVAGAVLGEGLTFERLCQVVQLDEQIGLRALEELLGCGWLCEENPAEDPQAFGGYTFPGEVIRQVVYQEAGATRLRLMQRRVSAVLQEEAEDDQGEEVGFPPPTPLDWHAPAEPRARPGSRAVTQAVSRGMRGRHRAAAKDASGATWRQAGARRGEHPLLVLWERGAAGQAASAFPRSPPGHPARAVFETRPRGGKSL